MGRLEGKVALITGASSGIGFDTARAMSEEGAFVFMTARRKDVLEKAAGSLGTNVRAIAADVSKRSDMENVMKIIKEEKGHLDVIFANAGIGRYVSLQDVTDDEFHRVFDVNVLGTIHTVQCMLPILSYGASIIINTSMTASMGLPNFCVYEASKSAVRSFIFTWTAELRDRSIRVNALSPGVIPTAAAGGELGRSPEEEKKAQEYRASLTPLGRVGKVSDISSAAVFLASDESSYITSTELTVDGGLSRVFPVKL
ncbi:MAG: SDR family oxidoreductase [Pyramidobacter sp.]